MVCPGFFGVTFICHDTCHLLGPGRFHRVRIYEISLSTIRHGSKIPSFCSHSRASPFFLRLFGIPKTWGFNETIQDPARFSRKGRFDHDVAQGRRCQQDPSHFLGVSEVIGDPQVTRSIQRFQFWMKHGGIPYFRTLSYCFWMFLTYLLGPKVFWWPDFFGLKSWAFLDGLTAMKTQ